MKITASSIKEEIEKSAKRNTSQFLNALRSRCMCSLDKEILPHDNEILERRNAEIIKCIEEYLEACANTVFKFYNCPDLCEAFKKDTERWFTAKETFGRLYSVLLPMFTETPANIDDIMEMESSQQYHINIALFFTSIATLEEPANPTPTK